MGSSINLPQRLRDYLRISYLERECQKNNSLIYRALLKHGFDNFQLEILEFCDSSTIIEREQYYIDNLELNYNILKIARSLLGFKHSMISIEKMRINKKGRPFYGSKENLSFCKKSLSLIAKEIDNENNVIHFSSIRKAASFLNMHPSYLAKCMKNKNFYRGRNYIITFSKPGLN